MSESPVRPHRTTYEQRILALLKAVAANQSTITLGDLAWAINYQRTTRPLPDLLAALCPILEDNNWPPLTCLIVGADQMPVLDQDQVLDIKMQWRRCWTWARLGSDERQQLRGAWVDLVLGGDA